MGWPGGVFPGGCNDLRGVWGWLSFSCGMAHCGKGLISVFQGFFASIGGACILAGGLGIGLRHFPVSLQSFGNQLVHTIFISNNHASFRLW